MRKAILLTMAVAVVVLFAIPGSASAAWTKDHANNAASAELEVIGTDIFYETSLGGVTCSNTTFKMLLEASSTTGKINSFMPVTVTSQCQGRGAIAQCDVHEATADPAAGGIDPNDLRWVIHTATGTTVTITTGTITNTLTGFLCPHTLQLTPGTMTMTVAAGEVNTTSTATLSGNFLTDGDLGNSIATTVSGSIHVLGTITYGI
ncbi:MAG TPA: hypothetical protein VFR04_07290 [Solirubrobacterales bacterium]|nr:hypothetical protein [Solirubrobacterales bacterium]